MNRRTKKAFTLIELLIVIGIISLLAVTVLLALNPAEAQKKARDATRIKDTTTLQAALEQYIDSGATFPTAAGTLALATVNSGAATGTGQACTGGPITATSGNWLGIDVCAFIKTVPLDPSNGQLRAVAGTATNQVTQYRARVNASNYEIDVRQESAANLTKLTGDGGDATEWFEVYSGPNTTIGGN